MRSCLCINLDLAGTSLEDRNSTLAFLVISICLEVRKKVGFLYMRQTVAGSTKIFCMLVPITLKLIDLKLEPTGPVNPVLASCIKLFEKIDQ